MKLRVQVIADAVEVYEVTGAGPVWTRLQAAARRELTRFVGRDAEKEQIHRVRQLARDGHGQVAAIVAEPSIGKSRLVHEFSRSKTRKHRRSKTLGCVGRNESGCQARIDEVFRSMQDHLFDSDSKFFWIR